jgi:hypothetical protein
MTYKKRLVISDNLARRIRKLAKSLGMTIQGWANRELDAAVSRGETERIAK